mmetsp:Transcript_33301/g.74623  ORF Transcript_33301/g.74623 Transcript_33301/m.74623 type:complete len:250 (-) Transcript_33301:1774-2523(-)
MQPERSGVNKAGVERVAEDNVLVNRLVVVLCIPKTRQTFLEQIFLQDNVVTSDRNISQHRHPRPPIGSCEVKLYHLSFPRVHKDRSDPGPECAVDQVAVVVNLHDRSTPLDLPLCPGIDHDFEDEIAVGILDALVAPVQEQPVQHKRFGVEQAGLDVDVEVVDQPLERRLRPHVVNLVPRDVPLHRKVVQSCLRRNSRRVVVGAHRRSEHLQILVELIQRLEARVDQRCPRPPVEKHVPPLAQVLILVV